MHFSVSPPLVSERRLAGAPDQFLDTTHAGAVVSSPSVGMDMDDAIKTLDMATEREEYPNIIAEISKGYSDKSVY